MELTSTGKSWTFESCLKKQHALFSRGGGVGDACMGIPPYTHTPCLCWHMLTTKATGVRHCLPSPMTRAAIQGSVWEMITSLRLSVGRNTSQIIIRHDPLQMKMHRYHPGQRAIPPWTRLPPERIFNKIADVPPINREPSSTSVNKPFLACVNKYFWAATGQCERSMDSNQSGQVIRQKILQGRK